VTVTPAGTGGTPVTYTVTAVESPDPLNPLSCTVASAAPASCAVTGLTNGTPYTFTVHADNAAGTSAESAPGASPTTPYGVPTAPTALVATDGDGTTSIAFVAGSANGSAILNYQYSTDSGMTWTTRSPTATTSPIVITGLLNGSTYQVKLRAVNAAGAGTESGSVAATPYGVPAAPTALVATDGSGQTSIAFIPGSDNGSPITDYEYSLDGGPWASAGVTSSPVVVTGLINGTPYSVKVRAVNLAGSGAESLAVAANPA